MPIDFAGFDFFFYGTLVDGDVRTLVAGAPLVAEPATLADHATVPVGRGVFPMIAHWQGATAPGLLCRGVALEAAARLSYFESEGVDYNARRLRLATEAGDKAEAWVYVPTARLRRGPGRWDFARWCRYEKDRYLRDKRNFLRDIDRNRLSPYRLLWQRRQPRR